MLPVSTRTATTRLEGLPEGVRKLAPLGPAALLIEGPSAPFAPAALRSAAGSAGIPLLAVSPSALSGEGRPDLSRALACESAEGALRAVEETVSLMALLRCRGLLLSPGGAEGAGLPGPPRERPADGLPDVARARAGARRFREAAADRLCRRLHALKGRHPDIQVRLLPGSDPFAPDDLEAIEWVLGDLPGEFLGVALDTGALGLRSERGDDPPERWFDRLGPRLAFVLVSDFDGTSDDLLPGMGRLDAGRLRPCLSPGLVRVLRPSPRFPEGLLPEAARQVADRLGAGPGFFPREGQGKRSEP